jgi:CheY-like chemotaxis protein
MGWKGIAVALLAKLIMTTTTMGKILAMDDERSVRAITAGMLSSLGYEVVTATEGSEAVKLYKQAMDSGRPYDAVILDLSVPNGDSTETIQKLVEIDPEVRAIASDIYPSPLAIAKFSNYGFRGFVGKPYGVKQLDEVLHSVMTG